MINLPTTYTPRSLQEEAEPKSSKKYYEYGVLSDDRRFYSYITSEKLEDVLDKVPTNDNDDWVILQFDSDGENHILYAWSKIYSCWFLMKNFN